MSVTVTEIHELDDFPGFIAVGSDGKSEQLPAVDGWCCELCRDTRYETWARRIALPATIRTEAAK